MYGFDYELEPANEGIGSFFSMVLDKIKAAGEKIKDWIDKVALKLRRMTGTTDATQSMTDSAEVTKKIDEIGTDIRGILAACSTQINVLYTAYDAVGKGDEITDNTKVQGHKPTENDPIKYYALKDNKNSRVAKRGDKYYDVSKSYKTSGGMDRIDKSISKNSETMADWEKAKREVALALAEQKAKAEKVSTNLKSLASYGPLGETATKNGYTQLRGIFSANGDFGTGWKKVKVAAEWSTGVIKEALNKVVSMYDVGIRATDAFGARLTRGFVRKDNGEKMDKADLKELKSKSKFENKVYKSDKTNRSIATKRDDENFMSRVNESTGNILDRIYQMAYEDAMSDIASVNEALDVYDSVPGAYEFVEESYDSEFETDYDPTYDFV